MDSRRRSEPEPDDGSRFDEAVFATARLARRGRPVAGIVIAAVVGGLALVGVVSNGDAATTSAARIARPVLVAPDEDSTRAAPFGSAPIAFHARVLGRQLYVNGDVFTLQADIVVVSVGDLQGRTFQRRTMDLPGGSTAFRLGPNDQFDVAFGLEGWTAEVAWVTATAYDRAGSPLATVRQSLEISSGHDRVPGSTGSPVAAAGAQTGSTVGAVRRRVTIGALGS